MNYLTDIKHRLDSGLTADQIAHAINTERRLEKSSYRSINSTKMSRWLMGDACEFRIEDWMSKQSKSDDRSDYYPTLHTAFKNLIRMSSGNADSEMDVSPGSDDRSLILLAIQEGALEQSDLERADALAYTGTDVTTGDVQSEINRQNSLAGQWERFSAAASRFVLTHSQDESATLLDAIEAGKDDV